MKCLYFKICKQVDENSTICCDDGGGSHCGHFRNLLRIENRNIKKKKRGKNMKIKIDFWLLGSIILGVLVLLSILLMFIAKSGIVAISILTFWIVVLLIMLIIYVLIVVKQKHRKQTSFI